MPRQPVSDTEDSQSVLVKRATKSSKRKLSRARLAEALRVQTETLKSAYCELEHASEEQLQFLRKRIFHAELAYLKASMQDTSTEERPKASKPDKKGKSAASRARRRKKQVRKAGAGK